MYIKLLITVMAILLPLSAQIYDTDEQTRQSPLVTGDTVSDELPAPLPEGNFSRPATTNTPFELVATTSAGENFKVAKKLAGMGMGLYFAGLGLAYGVALPLEIAATEESIALTAAVFSIAATGFKISGATRAGVGAGIAYNVATRQGFAPDRNINWGLYRAGWAFSAVSTVMYLTLLIGVGNDMDFETAMVVNTIRMTSGIAADVMWTVQVINCLKYARNATENNNSRSGFSVTPVYSLARKSVGAVGVWSF